VKLPSTRGMRVFSYRPDKAETRRGLPFLRQMGPRPATEALGEPKTNRVERRESRAVVGFATCAPDAV
jgi:hypothetical protein